MIPALIRSTLASATPTELDRASTHLRNAAAIIARRRLAKRLPVPRIATLCDCRDLVVASDDDALSVAKWPAADAAQSVINYRHAAAMCHRSERRFAVPAAVATGT